MMKRTNLHVNEPEVDEWERFWICDGWNERESQKVLLFSMQFRFGSIRLIIVAFSHFAPIIIYHSGNSSINRYGNGKCEIREFMKIVCLWIEYFPRYLNFAAERYALHQVFCSYVFIHLFIVIILDNDAVLLLAAENHTEIETNFEITHKMR